MRTKMLLFLSTALLSASILFFTGCGKYEDGPAFSLSSKKGRVVNTWRFEKVFNVTTGTDYTSDYNNDNIEFKKDGTYIWTEGSSSDIGTWVFASDKENIVLTENGSSSGESYQIRRLKGKQFWIRDDVGTNYSYEYRLSKK